MRGPVNAWVMRRVPVLPVVCFQLPAVCCLFPVARSLLSVYSWQLRICVSRRLWLCLLMVVWWSTLAGLEEHVVVLCLPSKSGICFRKLPLQFCTCLQFCTYLDMSDG